MKSKIFRFWLPVLTVLSLISCHSTTLYNVAESKVSSQKDAETIREIVESIVEKQITWSDLGFMVLLSLIWGAFFGVIIYKGVLPYFSKNKMSTNKGVWSWFDKHLSGVFFVTWCYGFITYFVGTFVGDLTWGGWMAPLSVIPMACIHATEMFIGQSDISAIHSDRHNSIWYMAMFDTSHLFAILVSALFVFKHFGYYIASNYQVFKEKFKSASYKDAYVFWGTSDATLYLAEDLVSTQKDKLINSKIFFVKVPDEDNQGNHLMGFDRLFNYVSMRDKELDKISSIEGAIMFSSHHRISELEFDSEDSQVEDKEIFRRLRLRSLAKILQRTTGRVNFFFLGENFDTNINAVINLMKDNLIIEKNVHIYCQAPQNAKTRWMQHFHLTHSDEKITIHIVDTAFLSIALLKQDRKYHPVQYIDTAKIKDNGIVDSDYHALILGMGQTGLEALRFEYEFGTFVNEDGTRRQGSYTIIDKDADKLEGGFYAKAPALIMENDIKIVKADINSIKYKHRIDELILKVSHVIIASGDDNIGINAAVDLCTLASRRRDGKHKLTVFVRSYDPENYNRLRKVQDDINDICSTANIEIKLFGSLKEIFTYKLIIDDSIIDEAKEYNFAYEDRKDDIETSWRRVLKIHELDSQYSIGQLEYIEDLTNQNICNSLHRDTKLYVCEQTGSLTNPTEEVKWNLAKMEHQRWVACHKLSGWKRLHVNKKADEIQTKDIGKKLHSDICNWDRIRYWNTDDQDQTRKYDLKVVETSLELGYTKNLK